MLQGSRAILEADGTGGVSVYGSPEQRSDASSGFSGALYDATGASAANAVGAPQSPSWASPSPAQPAPVAASRPGESPWWSDAAADPWRDPFAPSAVVITASSTADPVEPPDFTTRPRGASLTQVLLISVLAALLAGALGGALGYTAAVHRGGVASSGLIGGAGAPAIAQRAPTSLAGVVKQVMPSVVTIRVDGSFGSAIGSGFIVSSSGYVVTNDHVIDGLTGSATVMFSDATTAPATLVGSDPETDVAVLKLSKTGLPAVTFGDSDTVAIGDPVLAIGAPLNLPGTVTYGIISALRRPLEVSSGGGPTRYYAAIQTDAAVNHGNSGGPLFDSAGRVIGIDAVIESSSSDEDAGSIGLSFAIPIDQARRAASEIIAGQKVVHTVIGATVSSSFKSNPNGGVPLASVAAGGPADAAGIKAGDTIMQIGGSLLTTSGDLVALVRQYAPGTIVPVIYVRDGASHTAEVKLVSDSG